MTQPPRYAAHQEYSATESRDLAAIEAFDESVLHRPTPLDEVQRDAFAFRPLGQSQRMNSGPLCPRVCFALQPQLGGVAVPGSDAFQCTDDACGCQVEIHFDD